MCKKEGLSKKISLYKHLTQGEISCQLQGILKRSQY